MSAARSRRGAAAVELAVVLPLLLLLFVITVDYCRVYFASQTLVNAARSAALYASGTAQASDLLTVEQAAREAALAEAVNLNPPLRATDVTVTMSDQQAAATVRYRFRPLAPYPGLPAQIDMAFTITMPLAP